MRKIVNMMSLLALGIFLLSCGEAQSQSNLSLDQFVSKYKATPNAQLLDVRTPEEWSQGKFASSKCVNYYDATFQQNIQKLDKTKPVFVFCAVGGRSSSASKVLQKAGFKQIYNLQGAGYQQLAAKGIK